MPVLDGLPTGYEMCQRCGKTAFKQTQLKSRKYCEDCSRIAQREYKTQWAREHDDKEIKAQRSRKSAAKKREYSKENGPLRSASAPQRTLIVPEGLAWHSVISMIFTWDGSKNAIWSTNNRGHVFNRKAGKDYRDSIAESIAYQVKADGHGFVHGRVVFGLMVRKPDHRGDAVNFIDIVADALEDASGVDDRWYACSGVDWQVVKHNAGALEIVVGQPYLEEHFLCSSCGIEQTRDQFYKKSDTKHGVNRYCKGCSRKGQK